MRLHTSLPFILIVTIVLSCSDNGTDPEDPNDLSGTTDLELTRPGNEYGVYVTVGDQQMDLQDSVYIEKNDNGLVTVRIRIKKIDDPRWVLIPADLKNASDDIDTQMTFHVTSNGIQNYFYSGEDLTRPFTIIKYDAKVGDTYTFTTDAGKTVIRTITHRSEQDDWPLGFIYIKTIVTEEESPIEGIDKVIYRSNHKFGLVHVEYQLADGTSVKIDLLPWNVLQ